MTTAGEALDRALAAVDEREDEVRAWVVLDADGARAEAARVDRTDDHALRGVVLGIKDIFDTADMPTEYGSSIYEGHRPRADAGVVALLRRAGAIALGKTVTAELAVYHPGKTRNPHRITHTPGGSSSGSAAAVACGMCDIAIGTQTAGSVIRPASFCGVFGFKPTFGSVTTAGVKLVAPSLDTVGWYARDPALLDRVRVVLTGRQASAPLAGPPRIALVRTDQWDDAAPDSQGAVETAGHRAADAGATVTDAAWPAPLAGLAVQMPTVQAYEGARSLAWEHRTHRERLSASLLRVLDWGADLDPAEYDAVRARAAVAVNRVDELFGDADVLLTPAATGEAPEGLESTGDPRFARLWTLLGVPAVSVPGLAGATGLPIGVQLVGRRGDDALVISAAGWLAARLS